MMAGDEVFQARTRSVPPWASTSHQGEMNLKHTTATIILSGYLTEDRCSRMGHFTYFFRELVFSYYIRMGNKKERCWNQSNIYWLLLESWWRGKEHKTSHPYFLIFQSQHWASKLLKIKLEVMLEHRSEIKILEYKQ